MEGSMLDRKKFNPMLSITHLVAAFFKALFGLVGFLTWQENTDEVITNNLPTKELKILVNMILIVKALLSYPLPYFASVELLETTLFMTSKNLNQTVDSNKQNTRMSSSSSFAQSTKPFFMRSCYDMDGDLKFWAVCLRIALILFTLFLAIFIPHFAILMGLIGSITGTMLSLIWPCYFHIHLKRKSLRWYQIAIDIIIIAFGILITVTGIYYSSVALVKALKNENTFHRNYYKNNRFFLPSNATARPIP
jgi:vesicular inhibitory amino acid transporter